MIEAFFAWAHRKRTKHVQTRSRVTMGLTDQSRGVLIKCECGKVWAI